jgi:shikimate dehydrogenase
VLGAGGAARGIAHGLLARGAIVHVLNRTREAAVRLASDLGAQAAGNLGDLAHIPCDVLVNATSVGLRSDVSPVPAQLLPKHGVVMDSVYEPRRTRLLRDAESVGARTVEGKWMLVHQAAEQIRLWTGLSAPLDVMADAFDRGDRPADGARPG